MASTTTTAVAKQANFTIDPDQVFTFNLSWTLKPPRFTDCSS